MHNQFIAVIDGPDARTVYGYRSLDTMLYDLQAAPIEAGESIEVWEMSGDGIGCRIETPLGIVAQPIS